MAFVHFDLLSTFTACNFNILHSIFDKMYSILCLTMAYMKNYNNLTINQKEHSRIGR